MFWNTHGSAAQLQRIQNTLQTLGAYEKWIWMFWALVLLNKGTCFGCIGQVVWYGTVWCPGGCYRWSRGTGDVVCSEIQVMRLHCTCCTRGSAHCTIRWKPDCPTLQSPGSQRWFGGYQVPATLKEDFCDVQRSILECEWSFECKNDQSSRLLRWLKMINKDFHCCGDGIWYVYDSPWAVSEGMNDLPLNW